MRGPFGRHLVLRAGNLQLLLEAGADPDKGHPESGLAPLHGILTGNPRFAPQGVGEIVRLLLRAGADPNRRTKPGFGNGGFYAVKTRGETPRHLAAAYADLQTIQLLLDFGADRSLADAHGEVPVVWAGWHWRDDAVRKALVG